MNITESNELIAKFMGYKYVPYPQKDPGWRVKELKDINWQKNLGPRFGYLCRRTSQIRYYNSWDWLMTVVEKVFKLTLDIDYKGYISELTIFASREMTYKAVVEFIEWYNKQKS